MKISFKSLKLCMQVMLGIFVVATFWCVYTFFWSMGVDRRLRSDQKVLLALSALQEEAHSLQNSIAGFAVNKSTSDRIYEEISNISEQSLVSTPVLIGMYRMHGVKLSLVSQNPEPLSVLEPLRVLQALPIRLGRIELSVDDQNRFAGTFLFRWVEAL